MRNKNFTLILMALVAMSCFKTTFTFAQSDSKPQAFKIKTPNTSKQLVGDKSSTTKPEEIEEEAPSPKSQSTSEHFAQRRLHQHGLGLGLGETFLMGNYSKYGEDKITADILYSYAASYSFDLLLNAHMSEHKANNERMKLLGLNSSIKARVVEYDNFSPFVLGGLGFYAPQAKRLVGSDYKWSDQKITFGMNFGGGADLRLNDQFVVGLMGQLHWPFTIKQDSGSDIKGYYFKLLLTGMYLF